LAYRFTGSGFKIKAKNREIPKKTRLRGFFRIYYITALKSKGKKRAWSRPGPGSEAVPRFITKIYRSGQISWLDIYKKEVIKKEKENRMVFDVSLG